MKNYVVPLLICLMAGVPTVAMGDSSQKTPTSVTTVAAVTPGLVITGTLTKASGAPLSGRRVFVFPVDSNGVAIVVSKVSDAGAAQLWNPVSTTDAKGRFRIDVPLMTKIGEDEITAVSLSVQEPPTCVATVTAVKMVPANPKAKETWGMMSKEASTPFLSNASGVIRLKLESGTRDVGRVIVE